MPAGTRAASDVDGEHRADVRVAALVRDLGGRGERVDEHRAASLARGERGEIRRRRRAGGSPSACRCSARTSGALRWSSVSPAATSCCASKASAPAAPMRPPPAARARGSRASGSLTCAGGRAGASDLEASQRLLQPLADVRQVLARRRRRSPSPPSAPARRRSPARRRRVLLGRRRERLDLLRERLRLAALRVGGADDAVHRGARRGDLAVDLGQRLGGGADDGLAGGDAVARLNDLLLGSDGARCGSRRRACGSGSSARALSPASLRTSSATTANPLPCSPARDASIAAFSASRLVWRAMAPMASVILPMRCDFSPSSTTAGTAALVTVADGRHRRERFVGGDGAAPSGALGDVRGVARLLGVARDRHGARGDAARCLGGVA